MSFFAWYAHAKYSHKTKAGTFLGGFEYLQDHFKTPLATVHAFNGFADAFIGNRIGLNDSGGSYDGLSDLYLGYIRPGLPGDLTVKAFLHWFLDDGFGKTYGYEADAVAVKKLNEWSSLLLKLAYFRSDDEAYGDIRQASLQFDFKY